MKELICSSKAGKTNIVCKIDYVCSNVPQRITLNCDMDLRTIRLRERKQQPSLKLSALCAL